MEESISSLSDKISKTVLNIFAIALASGVALVFLFGFHNYYDPSMKSSCGMTWMYEFPHFVKIPLKNGGDEKYPMYGLYMYAEGRLVEKARRQEYHGIPVLFLPGNAGSYKQARSFASIALYKAIDMHTPFHFDFFSVDFNEEMSGLYGYVLSRQLDYTRLAIDRIMHLYEDFHHIVIIGHSMGGIIAKTVNADEIKSHLVFTLATPHAHPVAIFDPEFDVFYHRSDANFTKIQETDQKVTVVSIAGGDKDILVLDKLTQSTQNDFQTSVPSIPGAWTTTDHLSILWCNQFALVIVRILFDLVENRKVYRKSDTEYAKITTNTDHINSVLSYHLYKRPSGKSIHTAFPVDSSTKPPKARWDEILVQSYCQSESHQTTYIMYPMVIIREKVEDNPESSRITVITTSPKPKSWIFGCLEQDVANGIRYCSKLDNLSPYGEIFPNWQKAVTLEYGRIRKYSHLVVKTFASDFPFCTHLEVNQPENYPLPPTFRTENKIVFNYSLSHLNRRFTAWKIDATTEDDKCKNESSVAFFKHNNYLTHSFMGNESLIVRFTNWSSQDAHVVMYMNPNCNYNVSVRIAYLETAGQIFRTYIWILPAYITSVILISLFFQKHHEDWHNFHLLLLKNAFNLTVIPGLVVGALLTFIPSDYLKIMDAAEVSLFLPIFCYLAAYATVFLITAGGWYLLVGSGNALHAIVMKYLSKRLGSIPNRVTDYALEVTFAKFPIIIAVLLISLSTATCGGLGILAGFLLYVIKIFKMYEDMLEDLIKGKIKDVKEGLSPLNFHQTIVSLWFVVAMLNLPSVIFWVRNFGYGESPQWDMSLYISLMLTPVVAILWQDFVPKYNENIWIIQRYLSYVNGVLVCIWGTHRLYIISFFITLYLITLAFTQLFSSLLDLASKSENAQGSIDNSNAITEEILPEGEDGIPNDSVESGNDVGTETEQVVSEQEPENSEKLPEQKKNE